MDDFVFTEDGESPLEERNRLYNQNKDEDFGKLDTDRVVQAFKASLRVVLHCERMINAGREFETSIIDKCSYALNNLVELHYDKVIYRDIHKKYFILIQTYSCLQFSVFTF